MAKIMKYLLLTLVSLVVLIAVALAGVVLFVDPNDYKDEITAAVQDATGRELTLSGDIDLSVFPWLGLSLGAAQLSNAEGFGDVPFAKVAGVDIGVNLMPLLQKRLEMKTIRLHGLQVQLAKNADGRTNWDDLTSAKSAAAAKSSAGREQGGAPLAALAIGGLEVLDAHLEWDDRQAGQRIVVDKLMLTTGPVELNQPIDVTLAMDLAMSEPAINSHLDFSSQVALDLNTQIYRMDEMNLILNATGAGLPVSPLKLELSTNLVADLGKEQLDLDALKLTVMDLEAQGRVGVSKFQTAPMVQGKLTLANFSPRELMSALAIALPETADPDVLGKAKLALEFNANENVAKLNKLALVLDDSTLTGTASVSNFQQPAVEFDLSLDEIDVDRYLPPASDTPPPTPGTAAAAATQLPLETLRGLNVVGQLKAGKLKVAKARATNILLGLKAQGGELRMHPVQAKLYEGSYQGNIGLDVRTDTPKLSLNEKLSGIAVGPLLKDVLGEDRLTGMGDVAAVLTAKGVDPEVIKKTLNGTASFNFKDGAVKGVNIGQMIREANAKLTNQPPPPKAANQTDFTAMSGSVLIVNGLVKNNDLDVKSPLLRIGGKGTVDLPKEQIDYLVSTSVVGSTTGQEGKELANLKALTIPVKVTGSFVDPKFSLELDPLLKAKAKAVMDEKKQQIEKQAETKTEEKKEELIKNLEDKFKKLF